MTRKQRLLTQARRDGTLIQFCRRQFEPQASESGYVLGVTSEWVMIHSMNEEIALDGFGVFRLRDIKELKIPAPNHEFKERAFQLRRCRRRQPRGVRLTGIRATMLAATRNYPLIVVHRELIRPDVCWIGSIVAYQKERFQLREIYPMQRGAKSPAHTTSKKSLRQTSTTGTRTL